MLAGLAAVIGGLANLAFGHSHKADWFVALWGSVLFLSGATSIWNHSKAYVVHLRILRRVFGGRVRFNAPG